MVLEERKKSPYRQRVSIQQLKPRQTAGKLRGNATSSSAESLVSLPALLLLAAPTPIARILQAAELLDHKLQSQRARAEQQTIEASLQMQSQVALGLEAELSAMQICHMRSEAELQLLTKEPSSDQSIAQSLDALAADFMESSCQAMRDVVRLCKRAFSNAQQSGPASSPGLALSRALQDLQLKTTTIQSELRNILEEEAVADMRSEPAHLTSVQSQMPQQMKGSIRSKVSSPGRRGVHTPTGGLSPAQQQLAVDSAQEHTQEHTQDYSTIRQQRMSAMWSTMTHAVTIIGCLLDGSTTSDSLQELTDAMEANAAAGDLEPPVASIVSRLDSQVRRRMQRYAYQFEQLSAQLAVNETETSKPTAACAQCEQLEQQIVAVKKDLASARAHQELSSEQQLQQTKQSAVDHETSMLRSQLQQAVNEIELLQQTQADQDSVVTVKQNEATHKAMQAEIKGEAAEKQISQLREELQEAEQMAEEAVQRAAEAAQRQRDAENHSEEMISALKELELCTELEASELVVNEQKLQLAEEEVCTLQEVCRLQKLKLEDGASSRDVASSLLMDRVSFQLEELGRAQELAEQRADEAHVQLAIAEELAADAEQRAAAAEERAADAEQQITDVRPHAADAEQLAPVGEQSEINSTADTAAEIIGRTAAGRVEQVRRRAEELKRRAAEQRAEAAEHRAQAAELQLRQHLKQGDSVEPPQLSGGRMDSSSMSPGRSPRSSSKQTQHGGVSDQLQAAEERAAESESRVRQMATQVEESDKKAAEANLRVDEAERRVKAIKKALQGARVTKGESAAAVEASLAIALEENNELQRQLELRACGQTSGAVQQVGQSSEVQQALALREEADCRADAAVAELEIFRAQYTQLVAHEEALQLEQSKLVERQESTEHAMQLVADEARHSMDQMEHLQSIEEQKVELEAQMIQMLRRCEAAENESTDMREAIHAEVGKVRAEMEEVMCAGMNRANTECQKLREAKSEAQRHSEQLESENTAAKQQLEATEQQAAVAEEQYRSAAAWTAQLEGQLQEALEAKEEMANEISQLQAQEGLDQKLTSAEAEVERLREVIDATQSEQEQLTSSCEAEIDNLQQKHTSLIGQYDAACSQIEDSENEVGQARAESFRMMNEVQAMHDLLQAERDEKLQAVLELESAEEQVQELIAERAASSRLTQAGENEHLDEELSPSSSPPGFLRTIEDQLDDCISVLSRAPKFDHSNIGDRSQSAMSFSSFEGF